MRMINMTHPRTRTAPWPIREAAPRWKPNGDVTYSSAHYRIRAVKGRAGDQRCRACSGRAMDWAYVGGAPDERISTGRQCHGKPYSIDPDYYIALCRGCHIKHDRYHSLALPPLS